MWPRDRWPPLTDDRVGFLQHEPLDHVPGRARRYRILGPDGFTGWHGWQVDGTTLRHVVEADCKSWSRLAWPLLIHPIHDALHEDVLDRAEAALGGAPAQREWPKRVRLLRWVVKKLR